MEHVTRQLEQVRRRGRVLLIAWRLSQWVTAVLVTLIIAGVADYLLRLPGWLRLAIALPVAVVLVFWLVRRMARAVGFSPDLATLALRAERAFPHLTGALASGVEFATHAADYANPAHTHALAQASVADAESKINGVTIGRLISPARTVRSVGKMSIIVLFVVGIIFAAPAQSALALQRWFAPLGAAAWPKRTDVQSELRAKVWPTDAPLPLAASIGHGYREQMRVEAHYRIISDDGSTTRWASVLMNELAVQSAVAPARFERLLDIPETLLLAATASATTGDRSIEVYFTAGDDRTETQTVRLIDRPSARTVEVYTQPPAYARGLVRPEQISLHDQPGQIATASVLVGSPVRLVLRLNKPVPTADLSVASLVPGMPDDATIELEGAGPHHATLAIAWTMRDTVQTEIVLTDAHGLTNLSDRQYRIEATRDKLPTVTLLAPEADESVLASAVVRVDAMAQDDIGIASLALEADRPQRAADDDLPGDDLPRTIETLDEQVGRQPRMTLDHALDLSAYPLRPGDTVVLTAIAVDVYRLDEQTRDPVRSNPRTLRIIDESSFVGLIRTELAGVRQQADRIESQQRTLREQADELDPAKAAEHQERLSQRIDRQAEQVRQLGERVERNRLSPDQAKPLNDMLHQAEQLLDQAEAASDAAQQQLQEAAEQTDQAAEARQRAEAAERQEQVEAALQELMELLDQGRDVLTLQIQLGELMKMQGDLAGETREVMPRTLGLRPEDVTPEDRAKLDELARRQDELSDRAEDLVRRMQQTAAGMEQDEQPSPQKQAASEALREAAQIAQQQGLSSTMQEAAASTSDNQLSSAQQSQSQSSSTMQQMMDQLNNQQRRQQEILRRHMMELAAALKKLIEQQTLAIERLAAAEQLGALVGPMSALRRNTLSVADMAGAAEETAVIEPIITRAAGEQGTAIGHLREGAKPDADEAERAALASLEQALAKLNEVQKQTEEQNQQEQREQIAKAYEELAAQQIALRTETQPYAEIEQLTRKQRTELISLANDQEDLQLAIRELGEKVADTLVFKHMHKQIDALAESVMGELRAARVADMVLSEQADIAATLKAMADAFAKDPDEKPFDNPPESPEAGGGGGGGGPPPLVPPLAELKLLKLMQEMVYEQTRGLHERISKADAPTDAQKRRLKGLGDTQKQLADVADSLIQQLQQQQQQQGPQPRNLQ